ncbi:MAG: FecR family protein, partial [Burkholderiales bacterium]
MKRTLLGIIALLVSGAACAEPAGRVLLSVGEVSALRGGAAVALARGDTVESGDRIRTGPNSDAQIRFTDTSIVALRSNTDFGVERYHFSGKADGSENALFALLKGVMRTITGLIGRLRHDRYGLRTSTA